MRRVRVKVAVDCDGTIWTVIATLADDGAVLTVAGPAPDSPYVVAVNSRSCRIKTGGPLPVDAVWVVGQVLREGPIHDRLWPTAALTLLHGGGARD